MPLATLERMTLNFAVWIRQQMKEKRLTATECASRAGCSVAVWSRYQDVSANRQPERETVHKIADALGVPRAEALTAAGYTPTEYAPTPPGTRQFLLATGTLPLEINGSGEAIPFGTLPPEEQERLLRAQSAIETLQQLGFLTRRDSDKS